MSTYSLNVWGVYRKDIYDDEKEMVEFLLTDNTPEPTTIPKEELLSFDYFKRLDWQHFEPDRHGVMGNYSISAKVSHTEPTLLLDLAKWLVSVFEICDLSFHFDNGEIDA